MAEYQYVLELTKTTNELIKITNELTEATNEFTKAANDSTNDLSKVTRDGFETFTNAIIGFISNLNKKDNPAHKAHNI
ncbi:hypothetical protein RclHR1_01360016 [Rhizophagus clarus]|uniref:Uncharacterized protein n=1 Tax=Rhizophagus clarus TaxID=94130 RepID=A0A2Z6QCB7_9GLOM|nr:hypothetical protein RclHR1_01360016 [Rhizophagus clarus]GES92902.1 hypothetical protein RCL_jg28191.t1 [Rhizophagus clarus]